MEHLLQMDLTLSEFLLASHVLIARFTTTDSSGIRLPQKVLNWSERNYLNWIFSHSPQQLLPLFKRSLDDYLEMVHRRGDKTYSPLYMILSNRLEQEMSIMITTTTSSSQ